MDGLRGRGSSGCLASRGTGAQPHKTPGVWYSIVCKGGCRFMAVWVKEEEKGVRKPAEEKKSGKSGKGGQGRGCTWGDW